MPQRHEHLARAQQTEKIIEQLKLDEPAATDWAITMLFYVALHYIDAYLAGKNMHPPDHEQRDEEIENNGSLSEIYPDYRRLKDLSREARYNIANYGAGKLELARQRLARIKTHLSNRM